MTLLRAAAVRGIAGSFSESPGRGYLGTHRGGRAAVRFTGHRTRGNGLASGSRRSTWWSGAQTSSSPGPENVYYATPEPVRLALRRWNGGSPLRDLVFEYEQRIIWGYVRCQNTSVDAGVFSSTAWSGEKC